MFTIFIFDCTWLFPIIIIFYYLGIKLTFLLLKQRCMPITTGLTISNHGIHIPAAPTKIVCTIF